MAGIAQPGEVAQGSAGPGLQPRRDMIIVLCFCESPRKSWAMGIGRKNGEVPSASPGQSHEEESEDEC